MGVTFNMDTSLFFNKALAGSPANDQVAALVAAGVVFEVSIYSVKAKLGAKGWQVSLPVKTLALMNPADQCDAGADTHGMAVVMLSQFIDKLHDQLGALPAAPIKTVTAEALYIPPTSPIAAPPVAPPPVVKKAVAAVIALADAEVIGQKVRGTTNGSVYYAIAISKRVRVAAKTAGNNVSIRVEGKDITADDIAKIKEAGVSWHGSYGSAHIDGGNVPISRIVGAMLYSMGTKFDEIVAAGEALPS